MTIYWTLKRVPELASLPTKERRRVHAQCLRRYFWRAQASRRTVIAFFLPVVVTTNIAFGLAILAQSLGMGRNDWSDLIVFAIGFSTGCFIFSQIAIRSLRPHYNEFIERDRRLEPRK